ncbi:MAG: hypothetical protein AB1472_01370 [Candidatus Omnitrophota bacterium]
MDIKGKCVIGVILWGVGLLLLLAAAFDILPMEDNKIIFLALACFVIGAVIKKISKGSGGSCCK